MKVTKEKLTEWRDATGAYLDPDRSAFIQISEPVLYAEFCEAAREAMPALLDEVERLRKDLNTLAKGCEVRKVHRDWPALEGRIMRGIDEGKP
jgi:hypothetical protein